MNMKVKGTLEECCVITGILIVLLGALGIFLTREVWLVNYYFKWGAGFIVYSLCVLYRTNDANAKENEKQISIEEKAENMNRNSIKYARNIAPAVLSPMALCLFAVLFLNKPGNVFLYVIMTLLATAISGGCYFFFKRRIQNRVSSLLANENSIENK